MNSTQQRPTWLKLVFGFGPVLLFGGGLFLLDGAWQLSQSYVQRSKWPGVIARVQACSIDATWYYGGTPSKSTYVRCKLDYQAGDAEFESNVRVGDAITTYGKHRRFLTSTKLTIAKMQDWIARHSAGSRLAIHYDPSNPANISFAGEDFELMQATPYDRLWFGIFACTGGLALVMIGRLSRRNPG